MVVDPQLPSKRQFSRTSSVISRGRLDVEADDSRLGQVGESRLEDCQLKLGRKTLEQAELTRELALVHLRPKNVVGLVGLNGESVSVPDRPAVCLHNVPSKFQADAFEDAQYAVLLLKMTKTLITVAGNEHIYTFVFSSHVEWLSHVLPFKAELW